MVQMDENEEVEVEDEDERRGVMGFSAMDLDRGKSIHPTVQILVKLF